MIFGAGTRLLIAPELIAELRRLARDAMPLECCGLLVGTFSPNLVVTRLQPTRNIHAEPERFFLIDPQEQFDLLHALRAQERDGLNTVTVIGHYHSHPQGPPAPSKFDIESLADTDAIWLIIAPTTGAVRAYRPTQNPAGEITGFEELPITPGPAEYP